MKKIVAIVLSIAVMCVGLVGCDFPKFNEKTKIGLVVAVELDAVLEQYGEAEEKEDFNNFSVLKYEKDDYDLYVAESGPGQIGAAASTQYLITKHDVDLIVNFGVVGALTDEMKSHDLCVVDSIIHYDFDIGDFDGSPVGKHQEYSSPYIETNKELSDMAKKVDPSLKGVVCASGDKFVGKAEDKTYLHKTFNADICEMEAAGVAYTCDRNNVPFLMIKAISDSLTGGNKEYSTELDKASKKCIEVVKTVITEYSNSRENDK